MRDGSIVGEGTHLYANRKHAEIVAIEQAGEKARGSTLYINLEPCCHTGRTGPCADAVIAAGICRVVASMTDPNPLVAGQGFERMRRAGIEVIVGEGEREARKINEAFTKYIRTRTPLVTVKSAMTLDGKIAERVSSSGTREHAWITGDEARRHVHELRHESDAILVGVGTVLADDPLLTDRSGRPRRRPLLRVVLDSRLRIPLSSRIVQTAHRDVLIFCSHADQAKKRELERVGIQIEEVGDAVRPEFSDILKHLGQLEITSLLVEGGATVNWEVLHSGVADKVLLHYAPKILGDSEAIPFLCGTKARKLSDAIQVHSVALHRFGDDFAVEGYLRDPYAGCETVEEFAAVRPAVK